MKHSPCGKNKPNLVTLPSFCLTSFFTSCQSDSLSLQSIPYFSATKAAVRPDELVKSRPKRGPTPFWAKINTQLLPSKMLPNSVLGKN
jgi:hypothetical protein